MPQPPSPPSPASIRQIVAMALREDRARHDISSQLLVSANLKITAAILAKQELRLCGIELAKAAFRSLDKKIRILHAAKDGQDVAKGDTVFKIQGNARAILAGERVALNFLQRLSGVATLTRSYGRAIAGTSAKILDTRKTTPGLRRFERYAVTVGGGYNHRFDLSTGIMVKDNHLSLMPDIGEVAARLKRNKRRVPIVLEVKSLSQLKAALELGLDYLQLDNMNLAQLTQAVTLTQGRAQLEATGGVQLKNIAKIANTGVDYISIGALTHSAPAVDLSLDILDQF